MGRTRHGSFVYAADLKQGGLLTDLQAVCACARCGADHILFESDAVPVEDLPVLHPDFAVPA